MEKGIVDIQLRKMPIINSSKSQQFSSSVNTLHIGSTNWILDSGATNHMVHSLHFFKSITFSIQISVKLPNDDRVKVTHIGTVQVSASLLLENFLCILSFSFNLISINKLANNSSYCCIFLSNYCFLQDLQYWKMIGLGKKQGGLYTLQCTPQVTLPNSVFEALSMLSSCFHGKSVSSCNLDSSNSAFRL